MSEPLSSFLTAWVSAHALIFGALIARRVFREVTGL